MLCNRLHGSYIVSRTRQEFWIKRSVLPTRDHVPCGPRTLDYVPSKNHVQPQAEDWMLEFVRGNYHQFIGCSVRFISKIKYVDRQTIRLPLHNAELELVRDNSRIDLDLDLFLPSRCQRLVNEHSECPVVYLPTENLSTN